MQLYNSQQVLSLIHSIASTYLNTIQYNVDVEEMDDEEDTERYTVSMNTFLLKMMAKEMVKSGESVQDLSRILTRLDAHPTALPNNNCVTVITYSPIRISGNDSKIRAER